LPPHALARRFAFLSLSRKQLLSHDARSSNLRSQAPSFTPGTRVTERILAARAHRSQCATARSNFEDGSILPRSSRANSTAHGRNPGESRPTHPIEVDAARASARRPSRLVNLQGRPAARRPTSSHAAVRGVNVQPSRRVGCGTRAGAAQLNGDVSRTRIPVSARESAVSTLTDYTRNAIQPQTLLRHYLEP